MSGCKWILTRGNCREREREREKERKVRREKRPRTPRQRLQPFGLSLTQTTRAPSFVERLNVTVVPGRIAFWKVAGGRASGETTRVSFRLAFSFCPGRELTSRRERERKRERERIAKAALRSWLLRDSDRKGLLTGR